MADGDRDNVLWRKVAKAPAALAGHDALQAPATPARAVRTAFARAAVMRAGLTLTVLGVAEEQIGLDETLARFDASQVLMSLDAPNGPVGLFAADPELRAALIEMQTTGRLRPVKADKDRAVTRTDAALLAPVVSQFLALLAEACAGTPLAGWVDFISVGSRFETLRQAGLALEEQDFRLVRMTLDFGLAERVGEAIIALPMVKSKGATAAPIRIAPDWTHQLQNRVLAASTELNAVLHRWRLPLRSVQAFEVGQVIPLSGVAVSSIRVIGGGGVEVARARLGQSGGMRALRIEVAPEAAMTEVPIARAEQRSVQAAPQKVATADIAPRALLEKAPVS